MSPRALPTRDELIRLLEGELTQSRAAELERELRDSAALRREYEALRRIREGLAAPDEALEQIDLVEAVRAGAASSAAVELRRLPARRLLPVGLAGALACAAAVLLVVVQRSEPDQFRSKGTGPSSQQALSGIEIYSVHSDAAPVRLGPTLSRGDGLLFSYVNGGPNPYSHLMIFAVDERGAIFWFYPAFEDATQDPQSFSIAPSTQPGELRDLVRHDFVPGLLAVYAVFSRAPLTVSEIESRVREVARSPGWDPGRPAPLSLENSADHIVSVRVQ